MGFKEECNKKIFEEGNTIEEGYFTTDNVRRIQIRCNSVPGKAKPRFCDALIYEDGKIVLETKNKKGISTIALNDLMSQLRII